MARKITTRDIYENTGELKSLLDELYAVEDQIEKMLKREKKLADELEPVVKKLRTATIEDREEIEKKAKSVDEIEKRYKKYTKSLDDNAVKIAALKNAQRQINQVNKMEAKLLASKEGSYNRLSAQYSLNKIRLNQMSKAEREATAEGKKLVKESKELYEEMKRLQEETGKHQLNVGNYASALEGLEGPIGSAISGVKDMGKQLGMLARNPVVLILGALVGVVVALGNAFKRSEKGANLMAKASGVVNGIMSSLVKISVELVDSITEIFEDPKQAIKDFGKSILDNILNRFKAIPLVGKAVLDSLKAIWNRDMEALKKAGVDAFSAVNQAVTGLDREDQQGLIDGVRELTNEIRENGDAFGDLNVKRRAVAAANRELAKSVEDLNTVYEINSEIAGDSTLSFEEMRKAGEKARVALEERAKLEIQLAKNNLGLINEEMNMRRRNNEDVSDLADRQIDAIREVKSAEREYLLSVRKNQQELRQIRQDLMERDLDILIDGYNNQKNINRDKINDENLSLEERKRILDSTVKLGDESFNEQIKIIEEFAGKSIDANDLINESDAVMMVKKIRNLGVSEIIEGRVLEIIRDRKDVNYELAQSEIMLAKAEEERIKNVSKLAREFNQKRIQNGLERFDLEKKLEETKFFLIERTEEEKDKFILEKEKKRLEKIIELNEKHGGDLSKLQIEIIKNQIKAIENEINNVDEGEGLVDIYDLFGLNIDDEKKSLLNKAIGSIKGFLNEISEARIEAANRAVEASEREIEAAENALNREVELQAQGLANSAESRRKDLENAKKNQQEALREQQKAQLAQIRIQAIEQSVSLVTASANIWKSFSGIPIIGPALAVGAIAAMWGSFAGAKIKASQLVKQDYGEGGWDILDAGSHGSGDDMFLYQKGSKAVFGEGGEANATINKKMTKKYRPILGAVFDSLNGGVFEDVFQFAGERSRDIQMMSVGGVDVSNMEKYLKEMNDRGKGGDVWFENGNRYERKGGTLRIYRNGA
jgi:hypothetical protein